MLELFIVRLRCSILMMMSWGCNIMESSTELKFKIT